MSLKEENQTGQNAQNPGLVTSPSILGIFDGVHNLEDKFGSIQWQLAPSSTSASNPKSTVDLRYPIAFVLQSKTNLEDKSLHDPSKVAPFRFITVSSPKPRPLTITEKAQITEILRPGDKCWDIRQRSHNVWYQTLQDINLYLNLRRRQAAGKTIDEKEKAPFWPIFDSIAPIYWDRLRRYKIYAKIMMTDGFDIIDSDLPSLEMWIKQFDEAKQRIEETENFHDCYMALQKQATYLITKKKQNSDIMDAYWERKQGKIDEIVEAQIEDMKNFRNWSRKGVELMKTLDHYRWLMEKIGDPYRLLPEVQFQMKALDKVGLAKEEAYANFRW